MLWIDKYRPTSLSALTFHKEITNQLECLTKSQGFPHLIMYGPEGCGKRTRITAILRALYGPGIEKVHLDQRTITTSTSKKIDVQLFVSTYHIEINPLDFKGSPNSDKLIVQHLVKEMAQSHIVMTQQPNKPSFKLVIITNADVLSPLAQHALRRTLEKYMRNLRIVFSCTSISKLIQPIQSRCLLIRVPAPSVSDIVHVLNDVASQQGFVLDTSISHRIAEGSDRNLRRALLMLEALYVSNNSQPNIGPNTNMTGIELDWEVFIAEIAKSILAEQSGEQMAKIRPKLYDLLVHAIPPSIIFKNMTLELIRQVPVSIRTDIVSAAANYEHSMCLGSKPIYHLEAFVAKAMTIYKACLVSAICH